MTSAALSCSPAAAGAHDTALQRSRVKIVVALLSQHRYMLQCRYVDTVLQCRYVDTDTCVDTVCVATLCSRYCAKAGCWRLSTDSTQTWTRR